jgi:hypothetical protein
LGQPIEQPAEKPPLQRALARVFAFLFLLSVVTSSFAVPHVSKLIVVPTQLSLNGTDDQHGVLVSAEMSDGSIQDVTSQATFRVSSARVFAVETNRVCRAVNDGTAELQISFGNRSARVLVTVTNASLKSVPSFRQDVLPILTRGGCNAGACHGKLAGQNGFKLSLRGYAPEWDIDWLTKEIHSRRIDYAFPDESLVIQKALARVPHEGGQRFAEESRYHRVLRDWILARAPGPDTNETDAVRIEILPGSRTLKPGDMQQLLVRAFYNDGRARDVTWLAQFFSNDPTTASVTQDGNVKALRAGEATVRAHFQGQVEVISLTIPYTNRVGDMFARRSNVVDDHVMNKLKALRIPPSALSDDATFARRAFVDAIGTLPTADEMRAFVADRSKDKRAKLVDTLLARPEFVDYWTLQLGDLLQNRKERDHDVRGAKGVRAFHSWVREQVEVNRPWNELARDVLTATGDSVSKPQVGYYVTLIGEKRAEESEVTDGVAQAFLGTRIGCAKCHNHPLEKFTQDDYYHFAAFFSRVSLKRVDPMNGATALLAKTKDEVEQEKRIADYDKQLGELEPKLASLTGKELEDAQKKVAETKKKLDDATKQLAKMRVEKKPGALQPRTKKMMMPQPLDRTPIESKPGEDLRDELAKWITDPQNKNFSGAMVNRLWKHFMGVGLVEPVDDLRASNPATNRELWDALNREFVSHGYDLKHVMRLILNSRTYQLSAETSPGNVTDQKFYSHFYARRLPAEVMSDAVSQATDVPDQFTGYPVGMRAIQLPEPGVASYFLTLFGRSDRVTVCACERNGEVTLPQVLHLQNGDVLTKIKAEDGRLAALLKNKNDDGVIDELFLTCFARLPRAHERPAVKSTLASNDPRDEIFCDLFWALLNSKEFAFNH